MSKEAGISPIPASPEVRKGLGLKVWESGEVFRRGKTARDLANGSHANRLRNRDARRHDNKKRAGAK